MGSRFVFNAITGQLDLINDGVASIPSVQSESDLPISTNDGTLTIVRDTDQIYIFNFGTGLWTTTGLAVELPSNSSDPAGLTTGFEVDDRVVRPTLTLHPADALNSGIVSIDEQQFGGTKRFQETIIAENGIDASPGFKLDIGIVNATDINIGAGTNANTITIGNQNATVIIQGITEYQDVTNLNVADKLITINSGGSITTGGDAGLEVEEGGGPTGYNKTSVDRASWVLKAPATAGVATITPGAGGITLNQSSHDPVTIGTANGLSLAGQALSLQAATDSVPGALTAADHTTFAASAATVAAATASQTPNTLVKRDANADTSIRHVLASDGTNSVNVQSRTLVDAAGTAKLDWSGSDVSVTGNPVINGLTANTAVIADSSKRLISSSVTSTELGYVSGVTSPIQTQLTNKADRNANDLSLSSATLANNQAVAANVTGLLFSNAAVRSAQVQYSITIATSGTSLYEEGTLRLVQRGSDWTVARSFDGDDALVNIDVTNAGQVTYTSSNYTGFISGTLKFRATVTTV